MPFRGFDFFFFFCAKLTKLFFSPIGIFFLRINATIELSPDSLSWRCSSLYLKIFQWGTHNSFFKSWSWKLKDLQIFSHVFLCSFLSYFTNHRTPTLRIMQCFTANCEFYHYYVFSYRFTKWMVSLEGNEILKISYLSTFNFLAMLIIIHVKLVSWPITDIREGKLMRNNRYNTTCVERWRGGGSQSIIVELGPYHTTQLC